MKLRTRSMLVAAVGIAMFAADRRGLALEVKPVTVRGAAAAPVSIGGVAWESSLAAAYRRAEREGKPVLLLQLFGRLDQEYC